MSLRNKIVLIPFPFNDLKSDKLRPVLVLTESTGRYNHVVVAFITSRMPDRQMKTEFDLELSASEKTGLVRKSWLRLYRLTSLPETSVQRVLGELSAEKRMKTEKLLVQLFGLQK